MSLRIYLMRHGETEWSLSGKHTGRTEIPLTEKGASAARELGIRLAKFKFSTVLTSPRIRAQKTCELAGLTPAIEPDLAEWDYGDYEGLRSEEILQRQPDWNIFHDGCPAGESPQQVCKRADRLITRLKTLTGNIALFSHGHFGRVLGVRWIGLSIEEAQHFLLDTTSISILATDEHHENVPVIAEWNQK